MLETRLEVTCAAVSLCVLVFCLDKWHHGKSTSLRVGDSSWVTLGLSLHLPGPDLPHQTKVGSGSWQGPFWPRKAGDLIPVSLVCLMGWPRLPGENGGEGTLKTTKGGTKARDYYYSNRHQGLGEELGPPVQGGGE